MTFDLDSRAMELCYTQLLYASRVAVDTPNLGAWTEGAVYLQAAGKHSELFAPAQILLL